jgi:hypothetical protein
LITSNDDQSHPDRSVTTNPDRFLLTRVKKLFKKVVQKSLTENIESYIQCL